MHEYAQEFSQHAPPGGLHLNYALEKSTLKEQKLINSGCFNGFGVVSECLLMLEFCLIFLYAFQFQQ